MSVLTITEPLISSATVNIFFAGFAIGILIGATFALWLFMKLCLAQSQVQIYKTLHDKGRKG